MNPTKHHLRLATALAALAASLFAPFRLAAQSAPTGLIEGRVIHAAAGNNLKQVRVAIDGTALETFINDAGEFRLAHVSAGEVTLRASVAGLGQQSARVRVAAGQTARHDFDPGVRDSTTAPSRDQAVMLDAFTVAERELSAQTAALQEQRTAPTSKTWSPSRSSATSVMATRENF